MLFDNKNFTRDKFSRRENMSIKTCAELMGRVIDKGGIEANDLENITKSTEEFNRLADMAKEFLTERVAEKEFTRFLLFVQKTVVAVMLSEGESLIVFADQDGSLKGYTHTVILTVIGALIEDEVL